MCNVFRGKKKKKKRRVEVISVCCAGNPSILKTRQFGFVPRSAQELVANSKWLPYFRRKLNFRLPRCFWDYSHQGGQKAIGKCESNLIMWRSVIVRRVNNQRNDSELIRSVISERQIVRLKHMASGKCKRKAADWGYNDYNEDWGKCMPERLINWSMEVDFVHTKTTKNADIAWHRDPCATSVYCVIIPFPEKSAVGPVLGVLLVGPLLKVQSKSSLLSWVKSHNDLLSKLQYTETQSRIIFEPKVCRPSHVTGRGIWITCKHRSKHFWSPNSLRS